MSTRPQLHHQPLDIQTGAKKEEHLDPSLDLQEIWLNLLQMSLIMYVYLFVVDVDYRGRFHPTWSEKNAFFRQVVKNMH